MTAGTMGDSIRMTAAAALDEWAAWAESCWEPTTDAGFWGTGYDAWGVQTNQKYIAGMGTLAGRDCTFGRERALDRMRAALRFSLASHCTGPDACTDGRQWGGTWISPLGIERMMHVLHDRRDDLDAAELDGIRRMLTYEAETQLRTEIQGTRWARDGGNKPESNIWNGAILVRAAMWCPDHPHIDAWLDKAADFFVNGISVTADAEDDTDVGGKAVRDRLVGPNFFDHYALDHHGYLNVGYMVICLSNVAMLHYGCVGQGVEPPAGLYHHARELWAVVRRMVFPNGRLCRIGGDTRIRYAYCQDYLAPTLVMAADLWQDPHALGLLEGVVGLMRREQQLNGDGSFYSRRLPHLATASPYYYTRIESDKAAALSMVVDWLPATGLVAATDFEASVAGGWAEPEHGAVMDRCATRIASWSWRAASRPQGLCLPPAAADLAEWDRNLAGDIHFVGQVDDGAIVGAQPEAYEVATFPGGFLTWGTVVEGGKIFIAEGWRAEDGGARHQLAVAALPDGHTMVHLQFARVAARRTYLEEVLGVKLEIPNDFLTGDQRLYGGEWGVQGICSHSGDDELLDLATSWVNVDGVLGAVGIYGAESWSLRRRRDPVGGQRGGWGHAPGSRRCDALCWGARRGLHVVPANTVVLDGGCLLLSAATRQGTAAAGMQVGRLDDGSGEWRAVRVVGRDHRTYVLVANFGHEEATLGLPAGRWTDLASGQPVSSTVPVGAHAARLFGDE